MSFVECVWLCRYARKVKRALYYKEKGDINVKRSGKKFMSILLAAAMLVSPVLPSVDASQVLASNDAVEISTDMMNSEETDMVVSETETDSSAIEVQPIESSKVHATVTKNESDITVEGNDDLMPGDSAQLHVTGLNETDEETTLRLYFWYYFDAIPEDKTYWKATFTNPANEMVLSDLNENSELSVPIKNADGTVVNSVARFLRDLNDDGTVSARHLDVVLPAGASVEFDFTMSSNEVDYVVLTVPVMVENGEDVYFDPVSVRWGIPETESEDSIVVTDPETEDIQIEDSEVVEETTESDTIVIEPADETELETIPSETETIPSETETIPSETETNSETEDVQIETDSESETNEVVPGEVQTEEIEIDSEVPVTEEETEMTSDEEQETDVNIEETEINEPADSETESMTESEESEASSESETVESDVSDYFVDPVAGVEDLNAADFASMRLVVLTSDPDVIVDTEHIIANYDSIYLLQYESVEQSMNAYMHYKTTAEAVEPDVVVSMASEETAADDVIPVTEEENPIAVLSEVDDSAASQVADRVIALIDTGAQASSNVIDQVSLIDDVMYGNGHGDDMVSAIVSQNENAKILSVRTMGDDGRGTVSAIVAGIEYAISQNVDIINLSISSKTNLLNSVLEAEIQKAVDAGIDVVGAAGNDGADVADYMPGSVGVAWILGAADETGVRLEGSNYGLTVDYNVVGSTTSEAAAKFSGYISLYGTDAIELNNGLIYTTDYVPTEETEDTEENTDVDEGDIVIDDEIEETWQIDGYPEAFISLSKREYVWTKDTFYDFTQYMPYESNVNVECLDEVGELSYQDGDSFELSYEFSLISNPDYVWSEFVTFIFTDDRDMATVGSEEANKLFPEYLTQERNEGYGGIVPSVVGETVDGGTYTVLLNDEDFDLNGILLDYNPYTFKINNIADDGGFDVTRPGSYEVIYEMSYFMYYEYTWFVKTTVNVVDPATLEPGIYLTSDESTLMLRRGNDQAYGGYGTLFDVSRDGNEFVLSCYDDDYEVDVLSSSEAVNPDEICTFVDQEDQTKLLTIAAPSDLTEAVILSVIRPNYQTSKLLAGGGWQPSDLSEEELSQMSEEEFAVYEDSLSGESDSDAYMNVAASWTTLKSGSVRGHVISGDANITNYGWVSNFAGTNYGTVYASRYRDDISNLIENWGYSIEKSRITNFDFACASGHSYMGMRPNTRYTTNIYVQVQQRGEKYRVRLYVSFTPSSDAQGNYQTFFGSKTLSASSGARLTLYKRMARPFVARATTFVGRLSTTFGFYTDRACTDLEATLTLRSSTEDGAGVKGTVSLDEGTYWIKETRRISGTMNNTDVYGPITLHDGDDRDLADFIAGYDDNNQAYFKDGNGINQTTTINGGTNAIYNKPFHLDAKVAILKKTNSAGEPLVGAVYRLRYSDDSSDDRWSWKNQDPDHNYYTWYLRTDANGEIKYDRDHLLTTWNGHRSDNPIVHAGTAGGKMLALPMGWIELVEVQAPNGYALDSTPFYRALNVRAGANGLYTEEHCSIYMSMSATTPSGTVGHVDPDEPVYVYVQKKSSASSEILNLGNYSLANAQFGVFSSSSCSSSSRVGTLTTGSDGKSNTLKLQPGKTSGSVTYWVKEEKAPVGHSLNSQAVSVTFNLPADGGKTKPVTITNEPQLSTVDALVRKVSNKTNVIQGVQFVARFYDSTRADNSKLMKTWYLQSDVSGIVKLDNQHLVPGMNSSSFYMHNGKVVIPKGYLTIQEIKAPAQYIIDPTVYNWTTTGQVLTVRAITNTIHPCEIRLKKYDTNGTTPLAGVQFELTFVKASEPLTAGAGSYNPLLKEGQSVTTTTNANGEIVWSNLDQGQYKITEVKTTAGHTLLKDPITVTLPITMTSSEATSSGADTSQGTWDDYSNKWFFYDCLYEVTNDYTFKMPMSGSTGNWTLGYVGLGIVAIVGFGILCYSRRRGRKR